MPESTRRGRPRKSKSAREAPREAEESYRRLIELTCDYVWTLDEQLRLVNLTGRFAEAEPELTAEMIGLPPWNWPRIVTGDADFARFREALRLQGAFTGLELSTRDPHGGLHRISTTASPRIDREGRFAGFVGIARDITARRRSAALNALEHAVTRTIAEAATSRKILQAVMRIVCESERWDTGGYSRVEDETGSTRLIAGWAGPGLSEVAREYYRQTADRIVAPGGMISEAATRGEPIWVPELKVSQTTWAQRVHQTGARAHLFFPVRIDGKVMGVFAFSCCEVREPDAELLATLNVVGEQIGQYLRRREAEQVLRESAARFRALTNLSSDWYWELDPSLGFSQINDRSPGSDAWQPGPEVIGKPIWNAGLAAEEPGGWDALRRRLAAHSAFRDFVTAVDGDDGSRRYFALSGEPVRDREGGFSGYRGVARDITDAKIAETRVRHLATHDSLTGLPNRLAFGELLGFAMQSAQRQQRRLAVMFIDVDRFKHINDALGHEAGDQLLRTLASNLRQCLRASDVLARLGGDEFVALLPETGDRDEVERVAHKMLSAATRPVALGGREVRVTASIGIALYPIDAADDLTLMKHADMAMYLAKSEGKNNVQFFREGVPGQSADSLTMEALLRDALANGELSLVYQAKQDLPSGAVCGVEALLRWHSPQLGPVAPARFIPLAEETGVIMEIGRWVLDTACAQSVRWRQQGLAPVAVAVNLSPRQFAEESLVRDVAATLRRTGLEPELLELEITEGMVMFNPERAVRVLGALKDMGVRLAIDDFGTGYSSLAQLKRFPIDTLKIDRSFIRDLPGDAEDRAITEAIVRMGKTLGLSVIAEGVETEEQEIFLRQLSCDQTQGFYFSTPLSADKVFELLKSRSIRSSPS